MGEGPGREVFEDGTGEFTSSFFAAFCEVDVEALAVKEPGGAAEDGATVSSCEAIVDALYASICWSILVACAEVLEEGEAESGDSAEVAACRKKTSIWGAIDGTVTRR